MRCSRPIWKRTSEGTGRLGDLLARRAPTMKQWSFDARSRDHPSHPLGRAEERHVEHRFSPEYYIQHNRKPMIEPEQLPYEALDLLARACYRSTVGVFWGAPDQTLGTNSASGALVKLRQPVLVTAKHVIDAYLQRQENDLSQELQIGSGSLSSVTSRLLNTFAADLVTLDLSGVDVRPFADHLEFHEPANWPPERVEVGSHVILSGYPKPYRQYVWREKAIDFKSWHLHSRVHGTTEDRFSCVVNVDVASVPSPKSGA